MRRSREVFYLSVPTIFRLEGLQGNAVNHSNIITTYALTCSSEPIICLTAENAVATILSGFPQGTMFWRVFTILAVLVRHSHSRPSQAPVPSSTPTTTSRPTLTLRPTAWTLTPTITYSPTASSPPSFINPTMSPTMTIAPTSALSPPSCTICVHGNDQLYVNQSKAFSMPGMLAQTCGELLQTAELFQRDSAACSSIRTLGSYCGCPPLSPKACVLCPITPSFVIDYFYDKVLPVRASKYEIFGAPPEAQINCETLESAIQYLASNNDELCNETQQHPEYMFHCCGYNVLGPHFTLPPTQSPAPTPARRTCNVCLDGSDITLPNRTIALGALPVRNCSDLVTLADRFETTDSQCGIFQLLGPYCGCPVTTRACSLCPNGETVPYPNRPFPLLESFQGLSAALLRKVGLFFNDLTCGEFQSILDVDPASTIGLDPGYVCLVGQFQSTECGCSRGSQEILVTWLFRVSAFLSLMGAVFIVRDVMKRPPERRTTYHQVILGTTCFDIITSTAYLLSGLLLPRPAYEGHGTHGTCVFQGILIQLGLTSLFYSVLLSVYYLLMIKYNWKESRFRKYRKYFHLPIIAIGIALTAAASTSIAPQLGFCYVAIPPQAKNR